MCDFSCCFEPGGRAQILLACLGQVAGAHGRYIVTQSGLHSIKYVAEVLSKRFPRYKFTSTKEADQSYGFDTTKVRPVVDCHRDGRDPTL